MTFRTCRDCEHRWWMDDTTTGCVDLTDVLTSVAG